MSPVSPCCRTLRQSAAEYLKLCVAEGDLFGLGLALEAAAGDEALAKDHAAGLQEQARLAGFAVRYGAPEKGSSGLHFQVSDAGWMTHSLRVDGAGRLTIRTMVTGLYDHHHLVLQTTPFFFFASFLPFPPCPYRKNPPYIHTSHPP